MSVETVSIGDELKDSFKKTEKWVSNNLEFLNDIEYFYNQRSILEKEYATKLQKLCSEMFQRKVKVSATVSVGDEPSVTPGSLESSTLTMWNEILNKTELISKDRAKFGSNLRKVCDKLTRFQQQSETMKTRFNDLYLAITKDRDGYYNDLKKAKQAYDSSCEDVEHARIKSEKSGSEKATRKLQEKTTKMNIAKNSYIVKIAQTNRLKDKYYFQDLPEVIDGLQDVNEFKTIELNKMWTEAKEYEIQCNNSVNGHLEECKVLIQSNDFKLDTIMFIKHNLVAWKEPQDFFFQPSPIWHDDDQLITQQEELLDLKKKLQVANKLYLDNDKSCEKLQEKVSELTTIKASMKQSGNVDTKYKKDVSYYMDQSLMTLKTFINLDNKRVASQVEMETIQTSTGDMDLTLVEPVAEKKKSRLGFLRGGKSHGSSASNSEVTSNAFVNSRARTGSISTLGTSGSANSTTTSGPSRKITSIFSSRHVSSSSGATTTITVTRGTASYKYDSTAEDEVSIDAQESFDVVEPDDGSGWTLIKKSSGEQGLVPTSYITVRQEERKVAAGGGNGGAPPPVAAPRKSGKKLKHATVLYDYTADGGDEISLVSGETVVILQDDDGSGWTLGEFKGKKGLFPTSYVKI